MNVLIGNNIASVRKRMFEACSRAVREPSEVRLLAVSKTKSVSEIKAAAEQGLTDFGENYLKEAVDKIDSLNDLPLSWHFIGQLQSNKTRIVAEKFAWMHTLSSIKAARRLNEQRPESQPNLKVLVQVNVSQDAKKSGIPPDDLFEFLEGLMSFRRLDLRGLMTLPTLSYSFESQRIPFTILRELLEASQQRYSNELNEFDQLSMGMSADLEAAIVEGATWVRVGTDIFGDRG